MKMFNSIDKYFTYDNHNWYNKSQQKLLQQFIDYAHLHKFTDVDFESFTGMLEPF